MKTFINKTTSHCGSTMLSLQKKRNKQRKANILKYTLPGLENEIEIPFPDKKLPVCARCKKIYKTRELCRVRDGHTDVAWNTTHLCFRLDDSCFAENEKGDICLVDESTMKFVASHTTGPVMPYQTKKSDMLLSKTPICMACKQRTTAERSKNIVNFLGVLFISHFPPFLYSNTKRQTRIPQIYPLLEISESQ